MSCTDAEISNILSSIQFNNDGLLPVIVVDCKDKNVLMLAYADQEAMRATLQTGCMHYYSRSRKRIWKKGESSGHIQYWQKLILDCDCDTLLAEVEQTGGIACHTGRKSCFYRVLNGTKWQEYDNIIRSEEDIYGKHL